MCYTAVTTLSSSAAVCLPRWGSLEYGQYVDALQAQADRALRAAPEHHEAARQVVEDIMELEVDFWNMAYLEM